jgi:hypothetical protein
MHLCGTTRLYSGYVSKISARSFYPIQCKQGTAGGVPSTCLQDVVLVPFPTWLLLLFLPLLWFESTQFMSALDPRPRRTKAYLWLTSFYVLAIFAALLMSVLEIVRLARADRGIGLLPFDLVGLLAALALSFVVRGSSMKFSVHVVLMVYWTLTIVMLAVKTGTLVKLKGREDRKGTAYPTLDQVSLASSINHAHYGIGLTDHRYCGPPRAIHPSLVCRSGPIPRSAEGLPSCIAITVLSDSIHCFSRFRRPPKSMSEVRLDQRERRGPPVKYSNGPISLDVYNPPVHHYFSVVRARKLAHALKAFLCIHLPRVALS